MKLIFIFIFCTNLDGDLTVETTFEIKIGPKDLRTRPVPYQVIYRLKIRKKKSARYCQLLQQGGQQGGGHIVK
jgi:hypothetical protein